MRFIGNRNIDSIISLANYCSDDDTVFLEDDSGRVLLTEGKLRLQAMKNGKLVTKYVNFPFQQFIDTAVTGIIVAITGRVSEDGKFPYPIHPITHIVPLTLLPFHRRLGCR